MSDLRLLKRRLALTSILINGGFHLHLLVFPITMTGKTRYKVGPLDARAEIREHFKGFLEELKSPQSPSDIS